MGLCGGFRCGCGVTTDGSIAITGSGEPGDPFVLSTGAPLSCALTHSTSQSIATGSSTALTFDTETFDTGGLHSAGSPTRITVPAGGAGLWQFSFHLGFPTNATGARAAWLQLNQSSSDRRGYAAVAGSGAASGYLNSTHLVRLDDADFMEVVVNQTSGGALSVEGASTATGILQFAAVRLGD